MSGASGVSGAGGATEASAPRAIDDVVQIQAIPPEEMTPRVQQAIMSLMAEVDNLRKELDRTHRRLRELEDVADTDALLPVPNRRAFVRELNRMISFAQRYGTPSTLMFIDLNDMKQINDKYGHETGDKALLHVAQLLTENVRSTDVVGRLGGDEFGVILAQADEEVGQMKADTLTKLIAEHPFHTPGGDEIRMSLAYGTYTFRQGDQPDEALDRADKAMYAHKKDLKGDQEPR
ncbi:GGDEF domain-containing protein [Kordiimonas marina]|uniref:GGDEF domain-containing protein n=1 Tax=Kordiimonas marina TaxID=2872312 RepID=UPI001FF403AA